MKLCHKCGDEWVSERRIPGRTETCAGCEYDLYCCFNCRHYAPGRPNDCISPTIEPVHDKEKANFCGEFEFADDRGPVKDDGTRQEGRDAWGDLFGDG